jgi:fused signal recognition particle receptor
MNFASVIKNFFSKTPGLSDEFFDDLTDILVEGDFGATEAYKTAGLLKEYCKKEKITSPEKARVRLAELLEETLLNGGNSPAVSGTDLPPVNSGESPSGKLTVILLLGVNGVGKTTSAAKLAALYRDIRRQKPVLAAADTFRAAAIDQLKIHGERLGIRVIAHQQGGDPGAVVYDAIEAAQAGAGNVIIADTAGRMHTKSALVQELRKIDRIVESKAADASYIRYLVLDATTGRNALAQAGIFQEAVAAQGVILTKYDSTAKGGVVFSLASDLHLPVTYLCTGEKYGDIRLFDPRLFAQEFSGF